MDNQNDLWKERLTSGPPLLRLKQIVAPKGILPLSRSTWWAGVRTGRFPKPVRIGRITAWRVTDILELIN